MLGGVSPGRPGISAVLLGVLLLAAGAGADAVVDAGTPGELEASMRSSLLLDYREAMEGGVADEEASFPDTSAAVGRVFRMTVPDKMADVSLGDVVKIAEMGKDSLPSWLHWDAGARLLRGLPLAEDRGVHYIAVSLSNRSEPAAFSIAVHPEDHPDAEGEACGAGGEEPVTVLTVILDADLTKMDAERRARLPEDMASFSGVAPRHVRVLPVVNNRLFDMSAFMAGPGNAKKVVENGALLSWKLGCSLDASTVPDVAGVRVPAKDGAMSAKLGFPVVGWHVANEKPHAAAAATKRTRRQLSNAPTPVLAPLPPTTASEPPPPSRIVLTLSSPSAAAPTESSAPPARGPVPLPGKPTIRVRDSFAHTPTAAPPQPTRVMATTTTVLIQPTATRPTYVEATATPPPTRRPTKKPKKPKTTTPPPPPRDTKTTTAKPQGRVTPPPPGRATPPPGRATPPPPPNEKPVLRNPIDRVDAAAGAYFEVKIPSDTFFDKEDGTTDKLRLTLRRDGGEAVGDASWILFNATSQLLYGLPDGEHAGKHEYFLRATDKGGLSAVDAFEVRVSRRASGADDDAPAVFVARFDGEPRSVTADVRRKILLVKKLAYALGDRNAGAVALRNITKGSIKVEWTNASLPRHPCPREQLAAMGAMLADAEGRPTASFRRAMEPEFRPLDVTVTGRASCEGYSFVPPRYDAATPPASPPPPAPGTVRQSADDVYLHTVVPAVAVAAVLLTAGVAAMACYRKKREGKLTLEDHAAFVKKGVPIIFADELDDAKAPPSSSAPLILREEKPPLPPPEYPDAAATDAAAAVPRNREQLGEYAALRDEDPNAPPYQPPPPFTAPADGKGSRPKNMTPYRSPPPYVPP